MAATWQVEVADDFLIMRVTGSYGGAQEAAADLAGVPERCRAHNRRRVLIDITGMDGDIPQLDRFLLGKRVGRLWGRRVKVAILTHPERITRFFENVANNDGANVQVFGDVESARRWLLARQLLDAPER